jgi:hypothetical protein
MTATPEATGAARPRSTFTARLNTRIPPELDQRLRTFAVLRRQSVARVLSDLLDRHLPTDFELAGGVCNKTEATIAHLLAAVTSGEINLQDLQRGPADNAFWAHAVKGRVAEVTDDQH